MQHLREIDGDNQKQEHLVEVIDRGEKTQMSREQVDQLKERQDIRVADEGNRATVLHRIRG